MSSGDVEVKKQDRPSKASEAKDPAARVKELLEQAKGDRKTAALTMQAEGFGVSEIEAAFKQLTGSGIGGKTWALWKQEGEAIEKAGESAGPLLVTSEKAFMAKALERFKTLTNEIQAQIIDLGVYVLETVAPQVPADRPEDKVKNTKEWLDQAVRAFQPEKIEEI